MNGSQPRKSPAIVLRIIYFALAWSVLIYVFIAYLMTTQPGGRPSPSLPSSIIHAAPFVAAGLGLVALAAAWFIGSALVPTQSEGIAAASPGWQRVQSTAIVCGAIAEFPAITGLMLFFMGLSFKRFLLFPAVSLALFAFLYLRVQGWIEQQERADSGGPT